MRLTLACAFLLALAASIGASADPTASGTSDTPTVSAFYYPWFGNPATGEIGPMGGWEHWAQFGHHPPDDIDSVYYPDAGAYSADDPAVLAQQMGEVAEAGIDQLVVSWWGRGSPEDRRLPTVIAAAHADGIAVALHLEPYLGRSIASVATDVAYLRTLGITTVFVYQPFDLPPEQWAPLNDELHADGITTFAQTAFVGQAVAGHFSGIYTYDILIWSAARFARLCAQAHAHGLVCAPSVGPGYDARRSTADERVKPRRGGATYDSMWSAAIGAGADQVTITSFNEWQEGTQIEPAAPPSRHGTFSYGSYAGAWGLTGAAAATSYLYRTAYWVDRFASAILERTRRAPARH